jgi:4-hydroxybenzoate polyprenyltransferase
MRRDTRTRRAVQILLALVESLRPHQWLKNLLVFVPLVTAHELGNLALVALGVRAFIAFSLSASAIYLLNDLHDVDADRAHPHKRFRPIPSGRLPRALAVCLVPVLIGLSLSIAISVGHNVFVALLAYELLMALYTWRLKAVVLLDAFVLATGYALRVFVGALALDAAPSAPLLAFCVFLFLSLALLKRYAELGLLRSRDGTAAHARAYQADDMIFLLALGLSCGALAVLVLALYLGSTVSSGLRLHSLLTWASCVLLLYWMSYMWLEAHRGKMNDDPLVFAINDRTSVVLLGLLLVSAWSAL